MANYTLLKNGVLTLVAASLLLGGALESYAKPSATMKYRTVREENTNMGKETLILPYAFPSDTLGTTFGVGALAKGYGQDQLLVAGSAWGSVDDAYGVVLGLWDYKIPATNRLFFSIIGSAGKYPRLRAYTDVTAGGGINGPAGSNDSDKDDYIEKDGEDNWWEMKLEYVLPIGNMKRDGMADYHLKRGMLVSGASGGEEWNPLTSGATVLVLKQFNRYQEFDLEDGSVDGTMHPLEFGILYNNTDYYLNPSEGSSQYLSITHDFAWLDSDETWTFIEFEASKYFSLGANDLARQQVVALNFWTGSSPSWEENMNLNGQMEVSHAPPYLAGARLGGFYRMRAYPTNRFNDKSVIYTTAEYRFTPDWNPIGETSWLQWLKMDWMQIVGFVEGGRVANDYEASELFSDWKADIGIGLRAMMAGGVVRFDYAVSDEESAGWVMFGHPF